MFERPTVSLPPRGERFTPPANSTSESSPNCSRSDAIEATLRIAGCYKKDEAADPEIFVSAIATVLMAYPSFVAWLACDPLKGIPSRCKWLPTPADVKEFCDATMAPRLSRRQQDLQRAEQMARRALPAPDDVERRCAVVDNTKRRLGNGWGLKQNEDDVAKVLDDPEAALAAVKPIVGLQLSEAARDALKRRLESKS